MCENKDTPATHDDEISHYRYHVSQPITLIGCIFTMFVMSGCCALFLAIMSLIIALGVLLVKVLWIFVTYLWSLIG